LKVFLTASPEERARRRWAERHGREPGVVGAGAGATSCDGRPKCWRRETRADPPGRLRRSRPPADAVVLDTTRLSLEQQVQAVVALARTRLPG